MQVEFDWDKMSELFHVGGFAGSGRTKSYSSTQTPTLTSATISMFGKTLCAHCHQKALPVQKIIHRRAPAFPDYEDAGYRCTCKGAMHEMAMRLAADHLQLEGIAPESVTVDKKALQELVKTVPCRDLHDLQRTNNGNVTQGKANAYQFFRENENELFNHYYEFLAIFEFGRLIQHYCQQYVTVFDKKREEDRKSAQEKLDRFCQKTTDVA